MLQLNDIAKRLIEMEFADRQDKINKQIRGQIGDYPPYTTDCSSDFREYVAAQDIPGFGVHCYYAISKEPVNQWQKSDKGIYPRSKQVSSHMSLNKFEKAYFLVKVQNIIIIEIKIRPNSI